MVFQIHLKNKTFKSYSFLIYIILKMKVTINHISLQNLFAKDIFERFLFENIFDMFRTQNETVDFRGIRSIIEAWDSCAIRRIVSKVLANLNVCWLVHGERVFSPDSSRTHERVKYLVRRHSNWRGKKMRKTWFTDRIIYYTVYRYIENRRNVKNAANKKVYFKLIVAKYFAEFSFLYNNNLLYIFDWMIIFYYWSLIYITTTYLV